MMGAQESTRKDDENAQSAGDPCTRVGGWLDR
jgi:hypothetical protein